MTYKQNNSIQEIIKTTVDIVSDGIKEKYSYHKYEKSLITLFEKNSWENNTDSKNSTYLDICTYLEAIQNIKNGNLANQNEDNLQNKIAIIQEQISNCENYNKLAKCESYISPKENCLCVINRPKRYDWEDTFNLKMALPVSYENLVFNAISSSNLPKMASEYVSKVNLGKEVSIFQPIKYRDGVSTKMNVFSSTKCTNKNVFKKMSSFDLSISDVYIDVTITLRLL